MSHAPLTTTVTLSAHARQRIDERMDDVPNAELRVVEAVRGAIQQQRFTRRVRCGSTRRTYARGDRRVVRLACEFGRAEAVVEFRPGDRVHVVTVLRDGRMHPTPARRCSPLGPEFGRPMAEPMTPIGQAVLCRERARQAGPVAN